MGAREGKGGETHLSRSSGRRKDSKLSGAFVISKARGRREEDAQARTR